MIDPEPQPTPCGLTPQGWGQIPPEDLPPERQADGFSQEDVELLVGHLKRQGARVVGWVLQRGATYSLAHPGWGKDDGDMTAIGDLLHWQRSQWAKDQANPPASREEHIAR